MCVYIYPYACVCMSVYVYIYSFYLHIDNYTSNYHSVGARSSHIRVYIHIYIHIYTRTYVYMQTSVCLAHASMSITDIRMRLPEHEKPIVNWT